MKTVELQSEGYAKRYRFQHWLVAANGYGKGKNDLGSLRTLGRHMLTDEAFLLLKGRGYLITAGTDSVPKDILVQTLEAGKMLIVEQGEWHTLVLHENAQTLIIENADTGKENSEIFLLRDMQIAYIMQHTT